MVAHIAIYKLLLRVPTHLGIVQQNYIFSEAKVLIAYVLISGSHEPNQANGAEMAATMGNRPPL